MINGSEVGGLVLGLQRRGCGHGDVLNGFVVLLYVCIAVTCSSYLIIPSKLYFEKTFLYKEGSKHVAIIQLLD